MWRYRGCGGMVSLQQRTSNSAPHLAYTKSTRIGLPIKSDQENPLLAMRIK